MCGEIAAGSIYYSFSYPQITVTDRLDSRDFIFLWYLHLLLHHHLHMQTIFYQNLHVQLHLHFHLPLYFRLHPQSTYIRHYFSTKHAHMYLQPILGWKLQGDTLALQFFSPLRESFPQKLKHLITCSATTMETTGDSRWQKFTVVLTETTPSFVTKKEAAPSMTKHLPDVWKDKDAHFSQGPGPEYWAQL